jgi:hypothetical protein
MREGGPVAIDITARMDTGYGSLGASYRRRRATRRDLWLLREAADIYGVTSVLETIAVAAIPRRLWLPVKG